jgi:hypothetical protein
MIVETGQGVLCVRSHLASVETNLDHREIPPSGGTAADASIGPPRRFKAYLLKVAVESRARGHHAAASGFSQHVEPRVAKKVSRTVFTAFYAVKFN